AGLQEVAESFKDKYIETAKKVNSVLLISSLNILNDAEINYKAARNKRLHVELALIKLCYLQQAIPLSSEGNSISKKKVVDAAQPFELAFLRIKEESCFEAVVSNSIEKQFIEQERNKLFAFLQERLKNRSLQFNVIVEEKAGDRPPIEITLTSKEQFQKMMEM